MVLAVFFREVQMKRRTLMKATGGLAAGLAVTTMLTAAAWAADTVKIGAVWPKTGPLAGGELKCLFVKLEHPAPASEPSKVAALPG